MCVYALLNVKWFTFLVADYLRTSLRANLYISYDRRRADCGVLWGECCLDLCTKTNFSSHPAPNFTKFSVHIACGRGSVLIVVCYLLPVLLIKSCLLIMVPVAA